ncbi:unnamed protein product [Linum trigynum]|uniref:Uncharacterized protein n=1 Tax=Linum trigynum TaxID=586398 RepID=A0AAV2F4N9_9ROSI
MSHSVDYLSLSWQDTLLVGNPNRKVGESIQSGVNSDDLLLKVGDSVQKLTPDEEPTPADVDIDGGGGTARRRRRPQARVAGCSGGGRPSGLKRPSMYRYGPKTLRNRLALNVASQNRLECPCFV